MAKDFIGQELHVGDEIVYLQHYKTSSYLNQGVIKSLSEKTATMENLRRKAHDKIIKINRKMFLLKVKHMWDDEYVPAGLFTSEQTMEEGKKKYLEDRHAAADEYTFTWETYETDKLV